MKSTEKPKFLEVLTALAATFGKELPEAAFGGYWIALEDLSLDDVRRGAAIAMRSCKFMPVPAEIRELAGHKMMTLEDRALLAWGLVVKAIVDTSGYASVNFDPEINATIREMGGWTYLSSLTKRELLDFKAKDFARTYKAFAAHPVSAASEAARYLPGWSEVNCMPEFIDKFRARPEGKVLQIATGLPPLIGSGEKPKEIAANADA